jgi:hypothetical protein
MRCYHLNNFYLSGIHAGIQSAHAQHELASKYLMTADGDFYDETLIQYEEWAKHHKTIVVLNGGMQKDLQLWVEFLTVNSHHLFPWSAFYESIDALNGALTNVALVLPEHMYRFNRDIATFMAQGQQSASYDLPGGDTIQLVRGDLGLVLTLNGVNYLTYSSFEQELINRLSQCSLM